MPSHSEFKTLESMTADELANVNKYYCLHDKMWDPVTDFTIKADIDKNWQRIDQFSCRACLDIGVEVLNRFLAQKISLCMMLSPLLLALVPTIWIQALPIVVLISLYVTSMLVMTVGGILLRGGVELEKTLEKSCAPVPKMRGGKVYYDVNLHDNPGTKIYASLSYFENTQLMFGRYHMETDDNGLSLSDENDHPIKAWDSDGRLRPL